MSTRELFEHVPQVGRVEWIGVRPAHGAPMVVLDEALLVAERGIDGDRAGGGRRQVTLVMREHLAVVASLLGRAPIDPSLVRRNLVVGGINLTTLARRAFRVGECALQGSGECHPCSRMEEALGDGGYAAMRGHGGITARIVRGGRVRVGDPVHVERG